MYKSSLVQELLILIIYVQDRYLQILAKVKPNASKSIGVKFFKFSIIANFVVS